MKKMLKTIVGAAAALLVLAGCVNPVVDQSSTPSSPGSGSGGGTSAAQSGIFSEEYANIPVKTAYAQGSGTVSVAVATAPTETPFLGNEVLKATFAHSGWGGFFFEPDGASTSLVDYANGTIVFSINTSGMTGMTDIEIKMASAAYPNEVGGIVMLSTLSPEAITGSWKTYRVPLKSFTSYNKGLADTTAFTTFLGFWNPITASGASNGTLLVDEVYVDKANPLTVASTSAPAVNSAAGQTVILAPIVTYSNGAIFKPALSDFTGWASSDSDVVTVSGGTLTMVGAGTATITASYGSAALSVNVTVTATLQPKALYSEGITNTFGAFSLESAFDGGAGTGTEDATSETPDGSKSLKLNKTGGGWGGIYLKFGTAVDATGYSNLVFSINASGMANFHDLGVKFEEFAIREGETEIRAQQLQLKDYTPIVSGNWSTYTIPLSAFTNLNPAALNNLGFWNPVDNATTPASLTGTILIDNIRVTL